MIAIPVQFRSLKGHVLCLMSVVKRCSARESRGGGGARALKRDWGAKYAKYQITIKRLKRHGNVGYRMQSCDENTLTRTAFPFTFATLGIRCSNPRKRSDGQETQEWKVIARERSDPPSGVQTYHHDEEEYCADSWSRPSFVDKQRLSPLFKILKYASK